MDLSDILYERAKLDLEIANARLLAMSFEAHALTTEVLRLRKLVASTSAAETSDDLVPPCDADANYVSIEPMTGIEWVENEHPSQNEALASQGTDRLNWTKRLLGTFRPQRRAGGKLQWHCDELCGAFPNRGAEGLRASVSVTGSQSFTMSGWVVPVAGGEPFISVEMLLDSGDRIISKETKTYHRADVQSHFPTLKLPFSGFKFDFPMYELSKGKYKARIIGRTDAGETFDEQLGIIAVE